MKTLTPVEYLARHFTWSNGHGVTDASDIACFAGIPGGTLDGLGHGFLVVGKTKNILFLFTSFIRDREGDLSGWRFVSECGSFTITIVND